MGAHNETWDRMIRNAESGELLGDDGFDSVGAPLVLEAARHTLLRDLFPFTSVNRLCFAEGSEWPFAGIQPAYIEFNPNDSLARARYIVYQGGPYGESRVSWMTRDVTAAVEKLVRLLSDNTFP